MWAFLIIKHRISDFTHQSLCQWYWLGKFELEKKKMNCYQHNSFTTGIKTKKRLKASKRFAITSAIFTKYKMTFLTGSAIQVCSKSPAPTLKMENAHGLLYWQCNMAPRNKDKFSPNATEKMVPQIIHLILIKTF